MAVKKENEITVKALSNAEKIAKQLEEKDFEITDRYILKDIYMIPEKLDIKKNSIREILSKAVIIRYVDYMNTGKPDEQMITFKKKEIDSNGNIISQRKINCYIFNIEEALNLFKEMGYYEILKINDKHIEYSNNNFTISIQNVEKGDTFIEVETNKEIDTIDKLKQQLLELNIPIDTSDYFAKKAEIELKKVLKS